MGESERRVGSIEMSLFFRNVSDWLLLLIEGKENESVATSIQQWMLYIAYVHSV